VFELLAHLVDKSLVTAEECDDDVRYRLLEPIRQYARAKLREAGEEVEIAQSHRAWLVRYAEDAFVDFGGGDHEDWHRRLARERENFLAALEWGRASNLEPETNLRLAVALGAYWDMYGDWSLGRSWLESSLAASHNAEPVLRARALFRAGTLAHRQGELVRARLLLEECRELMRDTDNVRMLAETLSQLGLIANAMSERVRAVALLTEALVLHRKVGHPITIGSALQHLGAVMRDAGEYNEARALFTEGLEEFERANFHQGAGIALCDLALVARREGVVDQGRTYAERSLEIARRHGLRYLEAYAKVALGELALSGSEPERAAATFGEALAIARDLGATEFAALALEGLAVVEVSDGRPARAVTLAAAAGRLRESTNDMLPAVEREQLEARLELARVALGTNAAAEATAAGRVMSLEEAVAFALGADSHGAADSVVRTA
jgi:non-specific serine/threonine protein kinase